MSLSGKEPNSEMGRDKYSYRKWYRMTKKKKKKKKKKQLQKRLEPVYDTRYNDKFVIMKSRNLRFKRWQLMRNYARILY